MFIHCILANERPIFSNLQYMLFQDGVQLSVKFEVDGLYVHMCVSTKL